MPIVLYAEDNGEHRIMMRDVLKTKKITLIEAADGQQALDQVQSQCPDLILLDLMMPKLDGYDVMAAVKSDPDTWHIPIIVVSAWSTGDNRKRARQSGASDFVAKPYDPLELIEMMEAHLTPIRPE